MFAETFFDVDKISDLYNLCIYSYHCPEKLIDHKEDIIKNLRDKKLKLLSDTEKIIIISISEQLNISNDIPVIIDIVEDGVMLKNEIYSELLHKFILNNHQCKFFDNVDFTKIKKNEIRILLEESYLERNIPVKKIPSKIIKY